MVAVPGVVGFPSNPPPLGQGARDKPIKLVIQTSRPYDELQVMVDTMLDKAPTILASSNVDTDLKLNAPQLEIVIDRDKAATIGVEVETLAARSRRCSAGARSRASSAKASNTT